MSTTLNTALVTTAAKDAVQQALSAVATGVANHLSGDWSQHSEFRVHGAVFNTTAGGITAHTLRVKLTDGTTDRAATLPCIQIGAGSPPAPVPIIATQPVARAVALGGSATFTVIALSATALHYQWTKNGVNLVNANFSTLLIQPVGGVDAAAYACVVTNAYGSTTTTAATLTVVP